MIKVDVVVLVCFAILVSSRADEPLGESSKVLGIEYDRIVICVPKWNDQDGVPHLRDIVAKNGVIQRNLTTCVLPLNKKQANGLKEILDDHRGFLKGLLVDGMQWLVTFVFYKQGKVVLQVTPNWLGNDISTMPKTRVAMGMTNAHYLKLRNYTSRLLRELALHHKEFSVPLKRMAKRVDDREQARFPAGMLAKQPEEKKETKKSTPTPKAQGE